MALISSLTSLTLDLPPSCIAFCPTQPQFFVVGTYFLHPPEEEQANIPDEKDDNGGAGSADDGNGNAQQQHRQKRSGSLILFRLEGDTITCVGKKKEPEFAVLDVQWTPHHARLGDLLAVATSTGLLVFYKLETRRGNTTEVVFQSSKAVAETSILVLSLAWHPRRPHVIGLTLSDGRVCLCESTEGELWGEDAIVYLTEIHLHDSEAWTLAFSGENATNVLSGGDDVALQYSSINGLQERAVQWRDRKLHQAGVTAILPLTPDLAVTGSYDDRVRLVSFHAGARRQVLAEENLGGGVWRLKALTASSSTSAESVEPGITTAEPKSLVILASCMHAGARVVRLCKGRNDEWAFDVVGRFEENESMNYGCDVQPSESAVKSIVSTSFYDKKLCLWRFDLDSIA